MELRPEEWLALAVTLIASACLVALGGLKFYSPGQILTDMAEYFSFGNDLFSIFFLLLWILFSYKLFLMLYRLAVQVLVDKHRVSRAELIEHLTTTIAPLRLLWPLAIVAIPLFGLLDLMGLHLSSATSDVWLNQLDHALFGFSPFIYFPSTFHSELFEAVIKRAYILLQLVVTGLLILLLVLRRYILLRQFIFCFVLSLVIAFPFYAAVPCLDPNNYFVRNLGRHDLAAPMLIELQAYRPSAEVKNVIGLIETSETTETQNVPISCFPSGHALWSIFVVYFLAIVEPWTLALSLPWIFAVLSGGVYFGQHYVVDYLFALVVAIFCISIANRAIRPEQSVDPKAM